MSSLSRKDLLIESAEKLMSLIDKGSVNIYYYVESGIPKFDILIGLDGKLTNSRGKPINKSIDKAEELLLRIQLELEKLLSEGSSQTSLF